VATSREGQGREEGGREALDTAVVLKGAQETVSGSAQVGASPSAVAVGRVGGAVLAGSCRLLRRLPGPAAICGCVPFDPCCCCCCCFGASAAAVLGGGRLLTGWSPHARVRPPWSACPLPSTRTRGLHTSERVLLLIAAACCIVLRGLKSTHHPPHRAAGCKRPQHVCAAPLCSDCCLEAMVTAVMGLSTACHCTQAADARCPSSPVRVRLLLLPGCCRGLHCLHARCCRL
jgi:hypothetical protein